MALGGWREKTDQRLGERALSRRFAFAKRPMLKSEKNRPEMTSYEGE
jgi:hypothetical protein